MFVSEADDLMGHFNPSEVDRGWTGLNMGGDWIIFKFRRRLFLVTNNAIHIKHIRTYSEDTTNTLDKCWVPTTGPFRSRAIELNLKYNWKIGDEGILFSIDDHFVGPIWYNIWYG